MTPALTIVNDTVLIDEATQAEAVELVREAGDFNVEKFAIIIDGELHDVPEALSRVLLHVIEHAAEGGALTVRTMPDELTTTVAADLLGISRPTLMKMIAIGDIAARDVGSHKRLKASDVIELKTRRLAQQEQAFAKLRSLNV
jgi:excisionase family DNA binding protein